MQEGRRNTAKAKDQSADTLRSAEFMSGQGEEVDTHGRHVNFYAPCGLYGIAMKQSACAVC